MATFEQVRGRATVLVQCCKKHVPPRPVLQACRRLHGADSFAAQREKLGVANLADELAGVIAMGKPLFLLPAGEAGGALAQFCNHGIIQRGIRPDAVFVDEGGTQAVVGAAIGNAPGADAGFVLFDRVRRAHVNVATGLLADDAGVWGELQ